MPWKHKFVLFNIPDEFSVQEVNAAIAQAMLILAIQKNYKGIKDIIRETAVKF